MSAEWPGHLIGNPEKVKEERKREAYLMAHPALRWRNIMSAINWVEANRPPHLRRNQPRKPHQKFI